MLGSDEVPSLGVNQLLVVNVLYAYVRIVSDYA